MSEFRAGDRIGGRYVLLERLGLGGMGEVWLAEMEGAGAFRRRVVIKALAPERRGDVRIASMLADEARVVGLLHHPGIVAAVDYLESEADGPMFVLEFVDGCSLRSALRIARRRNAPMPEPLAAHVGVAVARALHAAHHACDRDGKPLHLVHRDISPGNVLLSRSGAVFLGDFGVARARGKYEVTDPGAGPKGKHAYMAPEQANCDEVGPAADIYSLGRVVAETAGENCGPALREVIERATAVDPKQRYQTGIELALALTRACPPPDDPDGEIAAWLHRAAPEALHHRRAIDEISAEREGPPPAGVAVARAPLERRFDPAARRGRKLRIAAVVGAGLALGLPLAWIVAEAAHVFGQRSRAGEQPDLPVATGELSVTSNPNGAQVFVDGAPRGSAPLILVLPAGHHSVRVGDPRTDRWRTADVELPAGSTGAVNVDLAQ